MGRDSSSGLTQQTEAIKKNFDQSNRPADSLVSSALD